MIDTHAPLGYTIVRTAAMGRGEIEPVNWLLVRRCVCGGVAASAATPGLQMPTASNPWEGSSSMFAHYRGLSLAIVSILCAAGWAGGSITNSANQIRGQGLLSPNHSSPVLSSLSADLSSSIGMDPIQAALKSNDDASWLVRDDRHLMSDRAARADAIVLPRLVSLNDVPSRAQPKVDPPDIVEVRSPDVNGLMAPMPVIGVGWAMALFAVFFYTGSRMLRIRRATTR